MIQILGELVEKEQETQNILSLLRVVCFFFLDYVSRTWSQSKDRYKEQKKNTYIKRGKK